MFPPLHCPSCRQEIEVTTPKCPGCGFSISAVDSQYGADTVVLARVTDAAHCLKVSEKEAITDVLVDFERRFPQLFFAVYLGALPTMNNLELFGFWLLNRATLEAVDFSRPNENGLVLVVDVNAKKAGLAVGYYVENFLEPAELERALKHIGPDLAASQYSRALARLSADLGTVLVKKAREAAKNPAKFQRQRLTAGADFSLKKLQSGEGTPSAPTGPKP